jgi:hypothetical protein
MTSRQLQFLISQSGAACVQPLKELILADFIALSLDNLDVNLGSLEEQALRRSQGVPAIRLASPALPVQRRKVLSGAQHELINRIAFWVLEQPSELEDRPEPLKPVDHLPYAIWSLSHEDRRQRYPQQNGLDEP